tara:strand:+ start:4586 stop:4984 length:399 start_codon:yes stop_codon:yes gene_type:complete
MLDSTFEKYKLVIDEWLVNGFNGLKAYQKFYQNASDESAGVRFNELVKISKIQEYKETKLQKTSKRLQITLEGQLDKLQVIANTAEKDSDRVNAIKEQNKLLALYKDHNLQKGDKTIVWHEVKNYGANEKTD